MSTVHRHTQSAGWVWLGDKTVMELSHQEHRKHTTDSHLRHRGCALNVQYQLFQLQSNVPWFKHGRLFRWTLRQRHICCFLFIKFRFWSCKLMVVGVYSLISEISFLATRTSVFMLLWLLNNSRHVVQFKLNLVLQHASTLMSKTSCSTIPYPAWLSPHCTCSLIVNRHHFAPNFLWSWVYRLNEFPLRLCGAVCLAGFVCVCVCVRACVHACVFERGAESKCCHTFSYWIKITGE